MDRIRKISHNGKEILYIDFSGFASIRDADQIMNLIQTVNSTVPTFPPKSVLTLTNIEGAFFNREILASFKESQDKIKAYQKKAAVIGVHGLQKIALDAVVSIARDHITKVFKTEAEAKDWLVE